MLIYIARFIVNTLDGINTFFDNQANRLVLIYNNTIHKTFPIIDGRIIVRNRGVFRLGEAVRFNCAVKSNFVGLNKTCTLAVAKGAFLEIGDYSGLSGVSIYCSEKIVLGKYVNLGGNVSIWDTDFHPLDFRARRIHDVSKIASSPVYIGDDVFIGANSIILKGVTIGVQSIIGAGSVVTRSVPAYQIWAGNPARYIRDIASKPMQSEIACKTMNNMLF